MKEVHVQEQNQQPGSLRAAAVRRRNNSEAGQALLELALLLPMMCLLLFGVVEIGRAAAFTIAVNNAASAGVGYGAQNSATASDNTGMQTIAMRDARNGGLLSGMTATATHGCLCDPTGGGTSTGISCTYPVPDPSSCNGIADTCSGQPVECVQVTTHVQFDPLLHYPGLPNNYQANGQAVMRVRQ